MFGMKGCYVSASGAIQGHYGPLVSSPEHNILKVVSFCGSPNSVVCCQHLPCEHSSGHTFCSIDPKFGWNVCLDKILDEFECGSSVVKNYVTRSN